MKSINYTKKIGMEDRLINVCEGGFDSALESKVLESVSNLQAMRAENTSLLQKLRCDNEKYFLKIKGLLMQSIGSKY